MSKILISFLAIVLLSSMVMASSTFITFNGNWQNGDTLYSDSISINNSYLYGNDVYPVRDSSQNIRIKNCTIEYKQSTKNVCSTIIVGYSERTRRTCKSQNNEQICTTETYLVQKNKRVCEKQNISKPYEKCSYITINPIIFGCLNPSGEYTNQLKLENFKYTMDGIVWKDILYFPNKLKIYNENIIFKLDIPLNCSPEYYYNKAVIISSI